MPASAIAMALALTFCSPSETFRSRSEQSCIGAIADDQLSGTVAGISVGVPLQRSMTIADLQARDQFRTTGSVAETQLEVWWFTVGLDLIVASVRGTEQEPSDAGFVQLEIRFHDQAR